MLKPALGRRDIQEPQLVQMVLENGVYPLLPQEIIGRKNRNGQQGFLVQWVGGTTESARGYRQKTSVPSFRIFILADTDCSFDRGVLLEERRSVKSSRQVLVNT